MGRRLMGGGLVWVRGPVQDTRLVSVPAISWLHPIPTSLDLKSHNDYFSLSGNKFNGA